MNKSSFDNLPELTKQESLCILATPIDKLRLKSDYYKAVFHLAKYPDNDTIQALMSLVESQVYDNSLIIAKRKAIEVLANLYCFDAIDIIAKCLSSPDIYTVENASWALGKLNCQSYEIHSKIGSLLIDSNQNRRVLVQSLNSMNAVSQLSKIKHLQEEKSLSPGIYGACIMALSNLANEKHNMFKLKEFLLLPNQNDRQCAIKDILDTGEVIFLEDIVKTPVAPFFRFQAINHFAFKSKEVINSNNIFSLIESLINDNPNTLNMIREYKEEPSIDFLIDQLFNTDFAFSYLALKILLTKKTEEIWPCIQKKWNHILCDYGAIYFVLHLFRNLSGWNEDAILNIINLARFCLSDKWPTYMKFRPIAILALFKIEKSINKSQIKIWLSEKSTPFWVSRYATLIGLGKIDSISKIESFSLSIIEDALFDSNVFVRNFN